jgi:hypothetical protein
MSNIRIMVNGVCRYGAWAGNPGGNPEDPTRCVEEIRSGEPGDHGHQCRSKRTVGLYCKIHSPEAKEKRKSKFEQRYALYNATFDISDQERIVVLARAVFKQEAAMEQLEVAVAELERRVALKLKMEEEARPSSRGTR